MMFDVFFIFIDYMNELVIGSKMWCFIFRKVKYLEFLIFNEFDKLLYFLGLCILWLGEVVYRVGEFGDCFYIVKRGIVMEVL